VIPYVPLEGRRWRLHMGLRPLVASRWLEFDATSDELIERKRDLIARERERVVVADDGAAEPCAELLEVVRDHLAEHHPERVRPVGGDHPLVEAALAVSEDLCVLARADAWRLVAAVVCFPSRWDLRTKLGRTLSEIHGPVPGYEGALARPVDAFFDRLDATRGFWRLNWTLLDSPELYLPDGSRAAPSGDLADWYFRVERQTFRRLARTGAAVFTIRTYVAPALELARDDPDFVEALTAQMASAPPDVQSYKGWVGVAERLARGS
jgi:Haem-dependent oxidative N-demethylase, alpha subunit-like